MDFEEQKKQVLAREDHSRKGSIDAPVLNLCNKINSMKNFYTTSSCSGRIMVYAKKTDKKFDTQWIFVSHSTITWPKLKKGISIIPKYPTWLKEESMILHVCARTLKDAQLLLDVARLCGFKRSGIMATEKRIMVEFTSTEIIDTLIADKGKLLVSEDYLKRMLAESNKKLKRNFEKIKKFETQLNELIKIN